MKTTMIIQVGGNIFKLYDDDIQHEDILSLISKKIQVTDYMIDLFGKSQSFKVWKS